MNVENTHIALSRAAKTQNQFQTIEHNAGLVGMQINNQKTKMLCISAARSYKPELYILSADKTRVSSSPTLKILGFTLSSEPNAKEHLRLLQQKFKSRVWTLRHLKLNGFKKEDLVLVYKPMVHPVAEYCSAVLFSRTTDTDSLELDWIQMQALKSIFEWRQSYRSLLQKSGLDRLDDRR